MIEKYFLFSLPWQAIYTLLKITRKIYFPKMCPIYIVHRRRIEKSGEFRVCFLMTHGMEFCSNWILFRRGCLFQMELAEKYDNLIWPILDVIYVCCSPHKLTF